MHELADSVARLTAQRSRVALERAALDLVKRFVPGEVIELFRCVGSSQDPRLLLAARTTGGAAQSVPASAALLESLPAVRSTPAIAQALVERRPIYDRRLGRHIFPVNEESRCLGVVELHRAAPLPDLQARLVESLVGVYRNQLSLLDYGETDTLTGLLNRKTYESAFFQAAHAEAAAEQRSPRDLERRSTASNGWIGVIDIDHFKRVNDVHGHLIGDELLLLVAQLMRASFRYDDALFRFGGEEFVVLLRAPTRDHAFRAFDRFRLRLMHCGFPRVGNVTASVGFTRVRPADLPSDAFERADRAVYFAKQHGRNQAQCFDDLLERNALDAADRVGAVELF